MIKLLSKNKIYSNGVHNAFTDITYFKGRYYLCFRKGKAHMSPDGKAVVLTSCDPSNAGEWKMNKEFALEGDVRDTKFFIMNDRLYLMLPVRLLSEKTRAICNFLTFTKDGAQWQNPVKMFQKNWVGWRPKVYRKKLYGAFYSYEQDIMKWKVMLYAADTEKNWSPVSVIVSDLAPNETEIEFMNGKCYAWVRREGGDTLQCESSQPYKKWNVQSMGKRLHAPVVQKVASRYVLGVREFVPSNEFTDVKAADEIIQMRRQWQCLSLWEWKRASSFKKSLVLEEGENIDAGYMGIAAALKNKKEAYVSYYLGNTVHADIYCAHIKIV